jgi:predicted transport protein
MEMSVFWEVIMLVILSENSVVSLHSSKIVDEKDILRTVSNTGIYCSSDKVTFYLV